MLDFYCPSHRLAVEVDGDSHFSTTGEAADAVRTQFLSVRGIRVIRFTNMDLLQEFESVIAAIVRAFEHPSPNPLPERGEGLNF